MAGSNSLETSRIGGMATGASHSGPAAADVAPPAVTRTAASEKTNRHLPAWRRGLGFNGLPQ